MHGEQEATKPYPGLRPFRQQESEIFFGRETQTDALVDLLGSRRFLCVTGPSGGGKSSLVLTGLLNALESGYLERAGSRWAVATLRPGHAPLRRLAEALLDFLPRDQRYPGDVGLLWAELGRGPGTLIGYVGRTAALARHNLLIVVDQFEEVFRYTSGASRDEADASVALLLESAAQAAVPIYVVLTMRSDFLGDCATFDGLPEAINSGLFLVPRMTRDQLRLAIAEPARVFGGRVDPVLVTRLLNDMGSNPDQLPLMQHAMMRLWEQKVTNSLESHAADAKGAEARVPDRGDGDFPVLTVDAYEQLGGLGRALSDHANEILSSLPDDLVPLAERVFRCLTEGGENGRDLRRPRRVKDVLSACGTDIDRLAAVVDPFRSRSCCLLLPPDDVGLEPDTVLDVSHESLIRQWDRLRAWTTEERKWADTYRRLVGRARQWDAQDADLLGKRDLITVTAWEKVAMPTAAWTRRYDGDFELLERFLNASREEQERRRLEEEEAWRNEKRREAERLHAEATVARAAAAERLAATRTRYVRIFVALAVGLAFSGGVAVWNWSQAVRLQDKAERSADTVQALMSGVVDALADGGEGTGSNGRAQVLTSMKYRLQGLVRDAESTLRGLPVGNGLDDVARSRALIQGSISALSALTDMPDQAMEMAREAFTVLAARIERGRADDQEWREFERIVPRLSRLYLAVKREGEVAALYRRAISAVEAGRGKGYEDRHLRFLIDASIEAWKRERSTQHWTTLQATLERAKSYAAELARADPGNSDRVRQRVATLNRVAEAYHEWGREDTALATYREALDLLLAATGVDLSDQIADQWGAIAEAQARITHLSDSANSYSEAAAVIRRKMEGGRTGGRGVDSGPPARGPRQEPIRARGVDIASLRSFADERARGGEQPSSSSSSAAAAADRRKLAEVQRSIGVVYLDLENGPLALPPLLEYRNFMASERPTSTREAGAPGDVARAYELTGRAYLLSQRFPEAAAEFGQALDSYRDVTSGHRVGDALDGEAIRLLRWRAEALSYAGDDAGAMEIYQELGRRLESGRANARPEGGGAKAWPESGLVNTGPASAPGEVGERAAQFGTLALAVGRHHAKFGRRAEALQVLALARTMVSDGGRLLDATTARRVWIESAYFTLRILRDLGQADDPPQLVDEVRTYCRNLPAAVGRDAEGEFDVGGVGTCASIFDLLGDSASAQQYRASGVLHYYSLVGEADSAGAAYPTILGNLAYDLLFLGNFEEAAEKARVALERAPHKNWIRTNLAHVLMFQGDVDAAMAVHAAYHSAPTAVEGQTWRDAILDDFRKFRAGGLTSPHMEAIEAYLARVDAITASTPRDLLRRP